ncbi:PAS domain S-box protein [Flaviaesturariibacter terrae]
MPGHDPIPAPTPVYPSAAQLRNLFDSSPDVICLFDREGRFVAVSAAARRCWGYEPADLIGRSSLDLVHPDDRAATCAAAAALLTAASAQHFENRYRRADGSVVYLLWSGHWNATEGLVYAIARDISAQRLQEAEASSWRAAARQQQETLFRLQQETEEELRRSNERFRLAARTDAIYDWDIPSNALHWGEGLQTIFGYASHELQMDQWEARVHPDERAALLHSLDRTLHDPAADHWEAEYQLLRPEGGWRFVHEIGYILRDAAGNALRMVGRLRDISGRRQREAELRKLSLIAEQTEDAIVITNAAKETTWVNDAFTRLTGYTLADMQGRRPVAVLEGPALDPATIARVDAEYALKRPFSLEALNYRKDGTPFWSIISIEPVLDANGNVLEYFSIRKDITERKELERQLEQQRQQMTAAVIAAQEKERSDMSQELHDNVNQVLTTVKLYQELLLTGIGDREELARKSMTLLQESINEIRSISKRLSAPSLGKIRLHESVRELADAVAATNKLRIWLDTAAIQHYEAPQQLHITLYRILQEQLTNILKHAGASEAWLSFSIGEGSLRMTLSDNGAGFDPTRHHAGIGLNNIRSRAESLGGRVDLQSSPGMGCRLTVSLLLLS